MAGVNSLVTNGIGPGSSVLFVLTGGLGIGEALPEVVEIPHAQGGGFWEAERPRKRKPREIARDPLREQIIAAMRGEAGETATEPDEFTPEPPDREQPRRQFLLESVSTLAVDFGPAKAAITAAEQRIAEKRAAAARDEELALMLILSLAA